MKILALNCGSATVKYQLYEIGSGDRMLRRGSVDTADHHAAIAQVLRSLADFGPIDGVGHRVVHGGEHYTESVLIDAEVERRIEECAALAPLHNPHNLAGYRAAREALPACPHVAVFDTAFHQTMPPEAFLYGLPYDYYTARRIRRYGFHGTSHRFVTLRYAELHGASPEDFRLVTCHLGNGASLCAVDRGRSVDTTMGFMPLGDIVMGTRASDLDPGAMLHLTETDPEGLNELIHRRGGLLGLSGLSADMRVLLDAARDGHERACLAIDVFCYRVRRSIGAFTGVLGNVDAIIFTGGIGENAPEIRARCCPSLDDARNRAAIGVEAEITPSGAHPAVWVIPTNEELLIARETARLIG